jgi:nuclear GTP-binding protein
LGLETSNRGTTNDRKKILNKVRESRKKKVKAAKKNPQWKSSA